MGQELINLGLGSGSAQHITSLEIAKVTGKMHKNLMRDIKTSEEAWHKVAGLKFELGSYLDAQNQKRPCYILTWPEALFIATKFNDEARARLVLRWMELEQAEKERIKKYYTLADGYRAMWITLNTYYVKHHRYTELAKVE